MYAWNGYQAGVNLGGWISQFQEAKKEHFDTFIQKEDIIQISLWGMDHVRLPIDYMVLEDDSKPFEYKEEGFSYIDNCIKWCEEYHLNIILDLHRTAGYAFHSLNESHLFEDELLQERFLSLWRIFSHRYINYRENVVFELLNEIVEPNSDRWNKLSKRAIKAIREIDKERTIILGGNHYNSIHTLKELEPVLDEHLVYTFHFYEPHIFTHQKAHWEPAMEELNFVVPYPFDRDSYEKYGMLSTGFRKQYYAAEKLDKAYLKQLITPALEFAKERNVSLYCGEYGVIDHAPMEGNLCWHKDLCELLIENKIGRAVWCYKLMDFPMVDQNSKVIEECLIKIVSEK
ncbi:MAG: hypothetical protein K0R92_3405 [Lachnospiraceae bacterium]|jgi:hypothetical protein|nr:hypothetical protein [Lachnospiraceae bacterium]